MALVISDEEIEELARHMTAGDPDRMVAVYYDEVVGRDDGTGVSTTRRVVRVPAWYLSRTDARIVLTKMMMKGEAAT